MLTQASTGVSEKHELRAKSCSNEKRSLSGCGASGYSQGLIVVSGPRGIQCNSMAGLFASKPAAALSPPPPPPPPVVDAKHPRQSGPADSWERGWQAAAAASAEMSACLLVRCLGCHLRSMLGMSPRAVNQNQPYLAPIDCKSLFLPLWQLSKIIIFAFFCCNNQIIAPSCIQAFQNVCSFCGKSLIISPDFKWMPDLFWRVSQLWKQELFLPKQFTGT